MKDAITLVACLLLLASKPLRAHEEDSAPEPADAVASQRSGDCHYMGAQMAWGAYMRFKGAAGKFHYEADIAKFKVEFFSQIEDPQAPASEILMGGAPNPGTDHEKNVWAGYKVAAEWIADKRPNPGLFALHALFFNACMHPSQEVRNDPKN